MHGTGRLTGPHEISIDNGEAIEVASVDPMQGPVFYLLSQRPSENPRFVRQGAACMHQSQFTGEIPGLLMRSVSHFQGR